MMAYIFIHPTWCIKTLSKLQDKYKRHAAFPIEAMRLVV